MTRSPFFRTIATAASGLLLGLSSLAIPADAPIPLEPGNWWVYREAYTERVGPLDATQEDNTRFEVRGTAGRPFVLQTGGFDPVSAPVERGEGWVLVPPWTGEDRLPLPLVPGSAGPGGPDGVPGWVVEAEEDVAVPAGVFSTLRCAVRAGRAASVLWIAPGVGVVRETHGPPGRRPELERVLLRWFAQPAAVPR